MAPREQPSRIVLLPQGPVADDLRRNGYGTSREISSQDECEGLLIQCGGDVNRMLGQKFSTLEQTLSFFSRMNRQDEDGELLFEKPLIVALTESFPLNSSVSLRTEMCKAFPILDQALWVLYVDLKLDPSFPETALRMGTFDDLLPDMVDSRIEVLTILDRAPFWRDSSQRRYMILCRGTNDPIIVRQHAETLAEMVRCDWENKTKPKGRSSGLSQAFRVLKPRTNNRP